MQKNYLRTILTALLLNSAAVQASEYVGGFIGAKFGINVSKASGTINTPNASTLAYGVQGGYLQGGFNFDIKSAIIGVGTYADFHSYEKHKNGITYGSQAFGLDTKIGLPLDDWLLYAKFGRGYVTGTKDLNKVSAKSTNIAVGVEYKFTTKWGGIVEYKTDHFSNKDDSISISNKTLSFGLNYYFSRKAQEQIQVATTTYDETLPEPEIDESEPPPDIGASSATLISFSATSLDPASWSVLLENKPVLIKGSNFAPGSANLNSDISKEIDDVASFASKYPDAKLELIGYSDSTGNATINQELSLARAEKVKAYLIKKGVAVDRINTKGEGSANPIGDNDTAEGREKNRRVEIRSINPVIQKSQVQETKAIKQPKPKTKPNAEQDSDYY
jgi:OmpA-OmpF porin, OOP family